jgi:hypothetical protein
MPILPRQIIFSISALVQFQMSLPCQIIFISCLGKVAKFYAFAYLQDETMDAMSNSMGNIRFVYISELIGTTGSRYIIVGYN